MSFYSKYTELKMDPVSELTPIMMTLPLSLKRTADRLPICLKEREAAQEGGRKKKTRTRTRYLLPRI